VAVASVLVVLSLTSGGCGGNEKCQQLQAQFDGAKERGAYNAMQATDQRMAASGCYD
jgi:hypothetical protein